MNLEIYSEKLLLKNSGVLSGTFEKEVTIGDENMPWGNPIVKTFLDDDDIQQMEIVSTCIGFVKRLTKQYRK